MYDVVMDEATVQKLAELARVRLADTELPGLLRDITAVLAYVSEVERANITAERAGDPPLFNVMREDGDPHEAGAHTKRLLAALPRSEDGFVQVQAILARPHD